MGKKSKTSATLPKDVKPYSIDGLRENRAVYDANKGTIANNASAVNALIPQLQQQAQEGIPVLNDAMAYNSRVLGGEFLNSGNPYLNEMVDITGRNTRNALQASLGSRGLTNGSDYANLITRALAENETGLRYNDYNQERNRMGQAAAMAPGMASASQIPIQSLLQTATLGSELPFAGMNNYARNLSGLLSPYGQQTQSPGWGNVVRDLATSAAIAFSDRRLKTNITKVGELDDGLSVYEYDYVWGERATGVMADEVAQLRPWALGPVVDGYATVDYGAL